MTPFIRRPVNWIGSPALDLILALGIGAVSCWTLATFYRLMNQSGMMMSPLALIVPLTALLGIPVAIAWAISAWAHWRDRPWAKRPRTAAMVGTGIIAMALALVVLGIAEVVRAP